jgi:hypothetical protein
MGNLSRSIDSFFVYCLPGLRLLLPASRAPVGAAAAGGSPLHLWMFLDSCSIFCKPENVVSDEILDALKDFSEKEGTRTRNKNQAHPRLRERVYLLDNGLSSPWKASKLKISI